MNRFLLAATSLPLLVGAALIARPSNAMAFTNHCFPASACSALPGDCPTGNASTYLYSGGHAQAGACGAGEMASATGERGGNAIAGAFFTQPENVSSVANGSNAQAIGNVDATGTITGSGQFTNNGTASVVVSQANNNIRVTLYGSSIGPGIGSFSIDQAGHVTLSCSGAVRIIVAYYGEPTQCVNGVVS